MIEGTPNQDATAPDRRSTGSSDGSDHWSPLLASEWRVQVAITQQKR